jgi:hypothetical protein
MPGYTPILSANRSSAGADPFAPAFHVVTGGALSAIAILSTMEYRDVPPE